MTVGEVCPIVCLWWKESWDAWRFTANHSPNKTVNLSRKYLCSFLSPFHKWTNDNTQSLGALVRKTWWKRGKTLLFKKHTWISHTHGEKYMHLYWLTYNHAHTCIYTSTYMNITHTQKHMCLYWLTHIHLYWHIHEHHTHREKHIHIHCHTCEHEYTHTHGSTLAHTRICICVSICTCFSKTIFEDHS